MSQETYNAETIIDEYSPLGAPVKKRAYTSHKIVEDEIVTPLEEPNFVPPSYGDFDDGEDAPKTEERPFNPQFSELDNKDKKMGAELMAQMVVDIYEKGTGLMGKLAELSEQRLDRHIAEGEIDPQITIPTDSGEMGIKEFAQEYNETVRDAFKVDDEFKEKVTPPLIRVFQKRGIGMTDEQLLAYHFGVDLFAKGVNVVSLRKTSNSIVEAMMANTRAINDSRPKASSPVSTPTPPPSTPPSPEAKERVEPEEEFTEKISEVVAEKPAPKKPASSRKKPTPINEQLEYFEPEEDTVYANLNSQGGFAEESKIPSNMPDFGDPEILKGIDKIAKNSSPAKKVTLRKVVPRRNNKKK